jgi:hypothetical protein
LAILEAHESPKKLTGQALEITDRIQKIQHTIQSDQERIQRLEADGNGKRKSGEDETGGKLELARAQLTLHQNEFEASQETLRIVSGDTTSGLQAELMRHQAQEHAGNNYLTNQCNLRSLKSKG